MFRVSTNDKVTVDHLIIADFCVGYLKKPHKLSPSHELTETCDCFSYFQNLS